MTRERSDSLLIVRRVAPDVVLLGFLEPQEPALGDSDYALELGPGPRERLSWPQVRDLVYVAAETRATDVFYAPPFGVEIQGVRFPDGASGERLIGNDKKRARLVRVSWVSVGPDGIAVSKPH
jgi:hypothetical protein